MVFPQPPMKIGNLGKIPDYLKDMVSWARILGP